MVYERPPRLRGMWSFAIFSERAASPPHEEGNTLPKILFKNHESTDALHKGAFASRNDCPRFSHLLQVLCDFKGRSSCPFRNHEECEWNGSPSDRLWRHHHVDSRS